MTAGSQPLMKMGAGRSSVVVDCVRTKVVVFSDAGKPAKESDRGAWRHNELSPPSMTASTRRRLVIRRLPPEAVQEVKPASCVAHPTETVVPMTKKIAV